MLEDWQALILGIVQGITEPIPISSSGHLAIIPWLFDWPSVGGDDSFSKTFDVALHLGTLFGVVAYFWRDLSRITASAFRGVARRRFDTYEDRLPWYIALSTIPAVLVGVLLTDLLEGPLSTPALIGVELIVFGVLLWYADTYLSRSKVLENLVARDAGFIGLAQALALMPGVSRSGITMTAAMARGFNREAAARFSFLMSVPVVLGAVLLKGHETFVQGDGLPPGSTGSFAIGIISSTITGYVAIWFLLRYVRNNSFTPFVIYRIGLGLVVLLVAGVRAV
jgi:undecaprenyl-diphosphatase